MVDYTATWCGPCERPPSDLKIQCMGDALIKGFEVCRDLHSLEAVNAPRPRAPQRAPQKVEINPLLQLGLSVWFSPAGKVIAPVFKLLSQQYPQVSTARSPFLAMWPPLVHQDFMLLYAHA